MTTSARAATITSCTELIIYFPSFFKINLLRCTRNLDICTTCCPSLFLFSYIRNTTWLKNREKAHLEKLLAVNYWECFLLNSFQEKYSVNWTIIVVLIQREKWTAMINEHYKVWIHSYNVFLINSYNILYFDQVWTLFNSYTCFFVNFAQNNRKKIAGFDEAKQCTKLSRFSRINLYKSQIPLKSSHIIVTPKK